MPNIMQLTKDSRELFDKLDELEPDEFLAELEKIQDKGMAVIAPLCDIIDELDARGNARKAKAAELAELAKKDLERIDRVKSSIAKLMQMFNTKKLDNGSLSVTYYDGQPSLEIVDEEQIPLSYKKATLTIPATELEFAQQVIGNIEKVTVAVSKSAIKKDTTDDFGVAGTRIVRNPYIKIKG